MAKKNKFEDGKDKKTFTCSHGKGKVIGDSCSKRTSKNICPGGHPCKRV